MRLAQEIISAIVIIFVITSLFAGFYLAYQHPNAQLETPVEVAASLNVTCATSTITSKYLSYSVIDSLSTKLSYSVKNHLEQPVIVDKLVPISMSGQKYLANLPAMMIPGNGYEQYNEQVNWAEMSGLSALAYPGDVFSLKVGSLERVSSGLVKMYKGNLPTTTLNSLEYSCPFKGTILYKPTIENDKMTAVISSPGCAPLLAVQNYGYDQMLIVGSFQVTDYYYEKWDIPFYIHIYGNPKLDHYGIYYRGGPDTPYGFGLLSLYTSAPGLNEVTPQYTKPTYFAYYINSQNYEEELYIDDSKTPALENTPVISSTALSNVVVGIAREKPANVEAPPIKICAVYVGTACTPGNCHCITINYSEKTFVIEKRVVGGWKIIKSGTLPVAQVGSNIIWDLRFDGIAVIPNPTPNKDTIISVIANSPDGVSGPILQKFFFSAQQGAVLDMLIAWEDLVGYYPPGSPRIDGNGDEWIRVTYFKNGIWRIAGFIAGGGFLHQFWIGNRLIFVKPHGVGWSNTINGIHYEYVGHGLPTTAYIPWVEHPVGSEVPLLAIFTSPYITIKGLYPGDRIVLATPGRTVTLPANNTVEQINVLKYFSPADLVTAFEQNGGIYLAIQPSIEHILSMLPAQMLIHVKGPNLDTWVPVPVLIKPHCNLQATLSDPQGGQIIIERTGELYKVYLVAGGSSVYFGVYPKVEIDNLQFTQITVYYTDGTYITMKPGESVQLGNGMMYYPVNGMGILLVTDKPIYFGQGMVTDKPFSKIVIDATSAEIHVSLGK